MHYNYILYILEVVLEREPGSGSIHFSAYGCIAPTRRLTYMYIYGSIRPMNSLTLTYELAMHAQGPSIDRSTRRRRYVRLIN